MNYFKPRPHFVECEENKGHPGVPVEHYSKGIVTCKNCQRVMERVLYEGAEWRSFESAMGAP